MNGSAREERSTLLQSARAATGHGHRPADLSSPSPPPTNSDVRSALNAAINGAPPPRALEPGHSAAPPGRKLLAHVAINEHGCIHMPRRPRLEPAPPCPRVGGSYKLIREGNPIRAAVVKAPGPGPAGVRVRAFTRASER